MKGLRCGLINLLATSASAASYTITIPSGLSRIANQLANGGNTLKELFLSPPGGTVIYKWNCTGFVAYVFDSNDLNWVDVGPEVIGPSNTQYETNIVSNASEPRPLGPS